MKNPEQRNRIIYWIDHRLPIFTFLQDELHEYPTPRNLNYLWNFGSLSGIVLVLSRTGAVYYFLHFLVVLPLVGLFEKARPLPVGISKPALSPSQFA